MEATFLSYNFKNQLFNNMKTDRFANAEVLCPHIYFPLISREIFEKQANTENVSIQGVVPEIFHARLFEN